MLSLTSDRRAVVLSHLDATLNSDHFWTFCDDALSPRNFTKAEGRIHWDRYWSDSAHDATIVSWIMDALRSYYACQASVARRVLASGVLL